jgi:hypothetical protein
MKLAAKDRKLLIIGSTVVLALLSLAAFIQPEDDLEEDHPSSYSVKSGGAKATYMLQQELGYKVDRWTQPPQELPNVADGTLLMLTSPEWVRDSSPTKEAIRKFLAAGGTVLATGYSSGWLIPDSGAMPAWGNQFKRSWDTYSAVAPTDITRSAPQITMPSRGQWYDLPAGAVPLQYPYGKGRVIWLASAAPISNAGLRIDANVRFLAAVLGSVHPQRIFWWEYAGEAGPSSNYGGPVTWAVTAQLGLLFLFALWSFARRSGPIRPAVPVSRMSSLEFVEALAGMYRGRRAGQTVVATAYRKFRATANRKLGTATTAEPPALARTIALRTGRDEAQVLGTLQEFESALYQPDLTGAQAMAMCAALHDIEGSFSAKSKEKVS